MKMKRTVALLTAVMLAACLLLCGCGSTAMYDTVYSKSESGTVASPAQAPAAPEPSVNGGLWVSDAAADIPAEEGTSAPSLGNQQNLANKSDVKLIYTASLSLQTTEFDECTRQLRTMVDELGGYFENSNTEYGYYNHYGNYNYRSSSYTIRVPAENYSRLLTSIGGAFHVSSQSESVEDIGQRYAETEGHLKTLKIKQERIQELLAKADTMTDIIELENALSDTEYEIEVYSNRLNNYNSLIGYSTVYVDVDEVIRVTATQPEDNSFGARVAKAFKRACNSLVNDTEQFVLWAVENVFDLLLWAVILIAIFLFRPVRRLKEAARKRYEKLEAKHLARKQSGAEKAAAKASLKADKKETDNTANTEETHAGE